MGRRSEHSRDQIAAMSLEAASRLVQKHGLSGLSARRIAAEIGYTPGTLYLVFRNLDELLLHLNGTTLDTLFQRLNGARTEDDGAEDAVLAVARSYLAFAQEHPRLWGAVFEHRLPEGERPPQWFQDKVDRLFSLVEEEVRRLPAAAAAPLAARALWSGVHGICILALSNKLTQNDPYSPDELVHSLVTGYLRGLASDIG